MDILFLIIGLLVGIVIGYLLARLTNNNSNSNVDQEVELKSLSNENLLIKNQFETVSKERSELQNKYDEEVRAASSWKEKHDALLERLEEQKSELNKLQEKFTKDFELIANRILDEKSEKFTNQNKKNIDDILSPLKERIGEFQKKVEESNKENSERSSAMKEQLEMLRTLNQEITQETKSLTQALRGDSKTQGNWGEFQLESILEKAGLEKDIHYSKEKNLKTEDGSNQRLDYIINMPDGKHLIIDSKVSLTAYSKYFDAETETEQIQYLRQHLDSILNHIKLLGSKDYQKLHGINTPDYVMMFIANEPALTIALKEDHSLFEKALEKNIVLVSTSTLLATLRTISYIWKQDLQNKNAIEIARQAANLYDKFAGFTDDLIKLGSQMDTASKTYKDAMNKMSDGTGNLIKRFEDLKRLGVNPSKNVDQRLIDKSDQSE